MAELPTVVTVDDAKNPTLLVRLLRTFAEKLADISNKVDKLTASIKFPSFFSIRDALQSPGVSPLNVTNLRGVLADPQPASVLKYSAVPTGLVLQGLRDSQLFTVPNGSAYDLYTTIGGNPNTVAILTSGTAASNHNLLSAANQDTVPASPVLGDMLIANSTPKWTKLAGNTAASIKFLTQTGTGAVSAIPVWSTIGAWGTYTPTFGAATGTFAPGVVTAHGYIINKSLTLSILLNAGAISNATAYVSFTLPVGTAAKVEGCPVSYSDNGTIGQGWAETTVGSNVVKIYKAIDHSSTWAISVISLFGLNFSIELQ